MTSDAIRTKVLNYFDGGYTLFQNKNIVYKQTNTIHPNIVETFRTTRKVLRTLREVAHCNRCLVQGKIEPTTMRNDVVLDQGSGTFLAERALEASYLKMAFHESHTIGHWCRVGPQNLLIRHIHSNWVYMTTEGDTSGNFGRPFWRYTLFCSALKKVC